MYPKDRIMSGILLPVSDPAADKVARQTRQPSFRTVQEAAVEDDDDSVGQSA
jgi:hypothetical protein